MLADFTHKNLITITALAFLLDSYYFSAMFFFFSIIFLA